MNRLMFFLGNKISNFIEQLFSPLNVLPLTISLLTKDNKQKRHSYSKIFTGEVYSTGVKALPIITIMGFAVGIFSIIIFPFDQMSFGIENIYGSLYTNFLFREVAPLITILIVIIRSTISITIELTQMNIDGEIDTLEILGIDPIQYLGSFRIFAGIVALPILTIYFSIASLVGGIIVTLILYQLPPYTYFVEVFNTITMRDLLIVFFKTTISGILIFLIAIYNGLNTQKDRGAIVRKTISSVITSIFFVLILNLIFTVTFYAPK